MSSSFASSFINLPLETLTWGNPLKNIAIIFSTLLYLGSASAEVGAYKLEVERDGVTYLQVALNTWQGEYPGPVIDVSSKQKNKTTVIKGWESLRELTVSKSCTIQNGLYHPWSQTKNSVINYYTLAPAVDYKVIKDVIGDVASGFYPIEGEGVTIQAGDQILNLVYLGEGVSMATLVSNGLEQYIYVNYDALENVAYFEKTLETKALETVTEADGTTYDINEQWLYVKCTEGYNVFITDSALLEQKGVKQGNIAGYGEITGAK